MLPHFSAYNFLEVLENMKKYMTKKIFFVTTLYIYICFLGNVYADTSNVNDVKISSPAAIVIDTLNGRVLYEKNGYEKRNIASLTKILTAIVTVENVKLDEVVTIKTSSSNIGGSTVGMRKGDEITVKALMYGMLMCSGNDCAYALAEYVGGDIQTFADLMMEKAKEIGAKSSSFKNPHGLDVEGHYSTAYDMALITRYALNNQVINEIVGTSSITIQFGKSVKTFSNTNRLLRTYSCADGVKTGFTNGANRCLIASATKDELRVIAVVLGSETTDIRFNDAKTLLEYALDNYSVKDISKNMNWYINLPIYKGKEEKYERYITREMKAVLTDEEYEKIYVKQTLLPVIYAPISKGYVLGQIEMYIDNEKIYSEDIILEKNIEKKEPFDYFKEGIKNMFKLKVRLI